MSQESYIDMFYPERFISLEGNELGDFRTGLLVIIIERL